jgi:hypothetical protein
MGYPGAMTRACLILLAPLLLAACGGPPAASEGRWVGTATPQGAAAHGPANEEVCVGPTRAVLTFRGRRFQLEPNEGTLVMPGFMDEHGALSASLTRPGPNHQAWTATFTGTLRKDDTIEGVLALPGCRADLRLTHNAEGTFMRDLLR